MPVAGLTATLILGVLCVAKGCGSLWLSRGVPGGPSVLTAKWGQQCRNEMVHVAWPPLFPERGLRTCYEFSRHRDSTAPISLLPSCAERLEQASYCVGAGVVTKGPALTVVIRTDRQTLSLQAGVVGGGAEGFGGCGGTEDIPRRCCHRELGGWQGTDRCHWTLLPQDRSSSF